MNTAYAQANNAYPVKTIAPPDIIKHALSIQNNDNKIQILTDEQATYAINNQLQVCDTYPTTSPTLPFKSTNNMLQSFCSKYLLTKCYVCFRLC